MMTVSSSDYSLHPDGTKSTRDGRVGRGPALGGTGCRILTPKPSLLPIGNTLLERRSRRSLTARLDGVG
eukprot:1187856-Prymnesium_polylepis.1